MKGIIPLKDEEIKKRLIVAIRHGETQLNDQDVVRGWTDTPLDVDAKEELFAVGETLKGKIDGIITCNLMRTLESALYVSRGSGAPILQTAEFLRTWNVGGFTEMPTDVADPMLEKLIQEDPDKTIEGGESFNEFKFRFLLGLISTLNSREGTFAFVMHGRNLATLNSWATMDYNDDLEIDPENMEYEPYPPASAHLFEIRSSLITR